MINIDQKLQMNYKLANSITYELNIPNQGDEHSAYLKHRYGDDWINNTFNEVLNDSGIYHMMCYPNILELDQEYLWANLKHINNRKIIGMSDLATSKHIVFQRCLYII